MLPRFVKRIQAYDLEELQKIRLGLVADMGKNGFQYYWKKMDELRIKIDSVLKKDSDAELLNDKLWTTGPNAMFSDESMWWAKESPKLYKEYNAFDEKSVIYSKSKYSGIGYVIKKRLNDDTIVSLVGNASWMTPQHIVFFKSVVGGYFRGHPKLWPIFLNMDQTYLLYGAKVKSKVSDYFWNLRGTLKSEGMELFKAALSGSGPFVLKVLQQINNNNKTKLKDGTSVGELAKDVFDSIPPMSDAEFELVLDKIDLPKVYKDNISKSTLGSASLAQAHVTKDVFGEEVVVKFLRPIYAYYFLCECDYLLTVIWKDLGLKSTGFETKSHIITKQTRQLLLFLVREYIAEFNYEQESMYTIVGHKLYTKPKQNIHSVQLMQYTVEPFPAMVVTLAKGNSMKKVMEEIKKLRNEKQKLILYKSIFTTMKKVTDMFFETIFWGKSSFGHIDMHQGNIILPKLENLIKIAEKGKPAPITIIDYGSSAIIGTKLRCVLLTSLLQAEKVKDMSYLIPKKEQPRKSKQTWRSIDKPTGILAHYKGFSKLSPYQQNILAQRVNKEEIIEKHHNNEKELRKFIKTIWKLCSVQDTSKEHLDRLTAKVFDYCKEPDFGRLFLGIVQHTTDLGKCVSNPVIAFGRGLAYLGSTIDELELALCPGGEHVTWDERGKMGCPQWMINSLVKKNLMRRPLQLIKFLAGAQICGN